MWRHGTRGVGFRRVRQSKTQGWKLDHTEGKPEYGEEPHNHHGKEVSHYPFEDHGEDKEHRTREEEDTPVNA